MLALAVCVILLVLAFAALPGGAKIIGKRDGKDVVQLKSGDRVYLDAEQMAAFEKSGTLPNVPVTPTPGLTIQDRLGVIESQLAGLVAGLQPSEAYKEADLGPTNERLDKIDLALLPGNTNGITFRLKAVEASIEELKASLDERFAALDERLSRAANPPADKAPADKKPTGK